MGHAWQAITEFLRVRWGIRPEMLADIAWTIVALVGYVVLRGVLSRLVNRRIEDAGRRYTARKLVHYALGLALLLAMLMIWLSDAGNLATYLGFVSAGLVIALQSPISNIVGWLILVTRKTFSVGDRIQIGDVAGDVIDINLLNFALLEIRKWPEGEQSTGRIVHVPNSKIFGEPLTNSTQGFNFIWNELHVVVTYESNWRRAKDILARLVARHSAVSTEEAAGQVQEATGKFMIHYEHLSPIVWTAVVADGIELTMRYLCAPRRRRSSSSLIWEEMLEEFGKCPDVELAYRTSRIFNNTFEGKPALRPRPTGPSNPADAQA